MSYHKKCIKKHGQNRAPRTIAERISSAKRGLTVNETVIWNDTMFPVYMSVGIFCSYFKIHLHLKKESGQER